MYPTPIMPDPLVFLDQLACAWADDGMEVNVIAPVPYFVELKQKNRFYKSFWKRKTENEGVINVFHPRYFRVPNKTRRSLSIEFSSFVHAVKSIIKKNDLKMDVFYSHFLTSGIYAGELSEIYDIPGFCAFGESSLWSVDFNALEWTRKKLSKLNGIVSVSSDNKNILVENELYDENKIGVFPNGVNQDVFFPRNKLEMRKKYNFPTDASIGIFVGSFSDNKGVLRTQEAAKMAGNVKMIYIGSGNQTPVGDNILFCDRVDHSRIPELLSAADFFVLPTKAEGCCNAIVEALACGLPVISSRDKFNDDILSNDCSIRVDPNDVVEISEAMKLMVNDESLIESLSIGARKKGKDLNIQNRARQIVEFMQKEI